MLDFANTFYLPEFRDHLDAVNSSDYEAMKIYSDAFVQRYGDLYAQYSLWWVKDPIRAWSRPWEYGFVFQMVESVARAGKGPLKILDAGSGFTFFPFFLAEKVDHAEVICCDFDSRLSPLFASVSEMDKEPVFRVENIESLSFPDETFDCVVSVSVLEHLAKRVDAFHEMLRVVRPGGKVILTMDYSRDDRSDITRRDLARFLDSVLPQEMVNKEGFRTFFHEVYTNDSLLITKHFEDSREHLPWKYPVISSVVSSVRKWKFPRFAVKDIGVAGFVFRKAG